LSEAVSAPRFVYDGQDLHCETGFSPETIERLAVQGPVVEWGTIDAYFGTCNGAAAATGGKLFAVGDPRREGTGIVLEA
jgi:gamma-glutamyltranspeptidase